MKVVSWNMKNVSLKKLSNKFSSTIGSYGLGNCVGDYMLNLVMGSSAWSNIANLSGNPADIFVIIELKSGGNKKGMSVSGQCLPTLNNIVTNMNKRAKALKVESNYDYGYAPPLVNGYHETVGVIYNKKKFSVETFKVFRDESTNKYFGKKAPAGVLLKKVGTTNGFQVIGIHAPPPKGTSGDQQFREPIQFSNQLQTIAPAGMDDSFFMGDFNCNPANTYVSGTGASAKTVTAFQGMLTGGGKFKTDIPNGTLSSVRQTYMSNLDPPASYLSGAYDNMIYNKGNTTYEIVVDMIGNARNINAVGKPVMFGTSNPTSRAILNAFNQVSDHLPVVYEI